MGALGPDRALSCAATSASAQFPFVEDLQCLLALLHRCQRFAFPEIDFLVILIYFGEVHLLLTAASQQSLQ